jgi:hypothetical protein
MSTIVPIQKDLSKASAANTIQIRTIDDLQRLGELLAKSGFFDDCKQAAQACVKVLCGAELGFPAFSSMTGIYLIKGKPAIGANLMAAAVKRHEKYDYRVVELSDKVCKIAFFEHDKEIGVSEFSASDAQKAGTQNMGKFPRNMLFARCLSNGVRWFCPDIFLGSPVYTPDELGATVDENGEVVELPFPKEVKLPPIGNEIWRQWKTPEHALIWASNQLPQMSIEELGAEYEALPAVNGKKAPAWVSRVNELVLEQF